MRHLAFALIFIVSASLPLLGSRPNSERGKRSPDSQLWTPIGLEASHRILRESIHLEDELAYSRVTLSSQSNRPNDLRNGLVFMRMNRSTLDINESDNQFIELDLPLPNEDTVLFRLLPSHVLPEELALKYPEIRTFTGHSIGFERNLSALVEHNIEGLHAQIIDQDGTSYFVDPAAGQDDDTYESIGIQRALRGTSDASIERKYKTEQDNQSWDAIFDSELSIENIAKQVQAEGIIQNSNNYQFVIAIATTGEYSRNHGNTVSSVLGSIATAMNRANGVFQRELGVFFQLHPENHRLVCLYPCSELSNQKSGQSIYYYIYERGIRSFTYDLAHLFRAGDGGIALVSGLCQSSVAKSLASSGERYVKDRRFFYLLCHELGHQLGATHTMSSCFSDAQYISPVEPGSGSTIMSYAGICSSNNIQETNDFVFHAHNLLEMQNTMERATSVNSSCGNVTQTMPETSIDLPDQCNVPVGNFFQLSFTSVGNHEFFSFDQRYPEHVYSITNRSIPRFRSWIPTKRPYRNFPNLYYIINHMTDRIVDEILPTAPMVMQFMATARSRFDNGFKYNSENSSTGNGAFEIKRVQVNFIDNAMLRIHRKPLVLTAFETVEITWDIPGTIPFSETVEVLVAAHSRAMDQIHFPVLDYVNEIADLNWMKIAVVPNNGSAKLQIPQIEGLQNRVFLVHLMLRSTGIDGCFYFDIYENLYFDNNKGFSISKTAFPIVIWVAILKYNLGAF